jgi:hypothetical protein
MQKSRQDSSLSAQCFWGDKTAKSNDLALEALASSHVSAHWRLGWNCSRRNTGMPLARQTCDAKAQSHEQPA